MGAQGVALAVSLAAIVQVVMLYGMWNSRSLNTGAASVLRFYGKIILLSAIMGLFLEAFRKTALSGLNAMTLSGSLMVCLITGALFFALFIAAGYGLKIPEIQEFMARLKNKILKK